MIKFLTSELLKTESTSFICTSSSCSNCGGLYPFLNHASSKISETVILCGRCNHNISDYEHTIKTRTKPSSTALGILYADSLTTLITGPEENSKRMSIFNVHPTKRGI